MKRSVLGLSMALVLAAVALILLIAPVSATVPVSGGTLRFPITEPSTLDPAGVWPGNGFGVVMQVFDGLTQLDQNGNVQPSVASAWTMSPDAKVYTFTLRSDVYFHNGRQVKAADFVYSWNRGMLGGGPSSSMFSEIVTFTAPSDFTFVVTLVNPKTSFPVQTAALPIFYVIPQEAASTIGTNPVGSGAFKFVSWTSHSKIVLQANPSYFGAAPFLNGVEYKFYSTPDAQWADYQAGNLDLTQIPGSQWSSVKTSPNVITHSIMVMAGYGFDVVAFSDIRVRQAFQQAINRSAIVSNWPYDPPLQVANGVVSPGKGSYDNSDITLTYNFTNALSLLAAAGWTDTNSDHILDNGAGTNLRVVVYGTSNSTGQVLANQLGNIGGTGVGAQTSVTTTRSAANIQNVGWGSDYPDPENDLYRYLTGDDLASRIHYSSATFDSTYNTAQATLDLTTRNSLYHSNDQRLVITDAVVIPIYYGAMTPMLKKPYVQDLRISSQGYESIPLKYAWLDLKIYLPLILR
jgi:oligopeptide transport system substrate-binding protein